MSHMPTDERAKLIKQAWSKVRERALEHFQSNRAKYYTVPILKDQMPSISPFDPNDPADRSAPTNIEYFEFRLEHGHDGQLNRLSRVVCEGVILEMMPRVG